MKFLQWGASGWQRCKLNYTCQEEQKRGVCMRTLYIRVVVLAGSNDCSFIMHALRLQNWYRWLFAQQNNQIAEEARSASPPPHVAFCAFALSLSLRLRCGCLRSENTSGKTVPLAIRHHSMQRGARTTHGKGKQHNEIRALVSNFLFIGWQLSRHEIYRSTLVRAHSNLYFIHAQQSLVIWLALKDTCCTSARVLFGLMQLQTSFPLLKREKVGARLRQN